MTLKIGTTTKGSRVWLQGLDRYQWAIGDRYDAHFTKTTIVLTKNPEGRKKVSRNKGGIIDLCSNKITEWADGSTSVTVAYTPEKIVIRRVLR